MSSSAASSASDEPSTSGSRSRRGRTATTMLRWSPIACSGSTTPICVVIDRAPVAALRAVAVVAELGHQLSFERAATRRMSQPVLVRRAREPVAGHRRAHDVERVGRVAAVRRRVGERADDVEELDDRARPAVRDEQRERVGCGERTWMKCTRSPSIVGARTVAHSLSRASPRASRTRRASTSHSSCRYDEVGAVVPSRIVELPRANGCERDAPEGPRAQRRERRRGTAKPWFDRCTRRTVSRWPRSTPSPHRTARAQGLAPLYVATFVIAAGNGVVFPLLADLQDEHDLPTYGLGIISGASFIASLIGLLLLSGQADRGRAKLLLLTGLGLSAVSLVLFALSNELWQFTVARALGGLAIGCYTPATRSIVARLDVENVGRNLGRLASTELGGFVAGPVVGAAFASAVNLDAPFWALAVVVTIVFIALARRSIPK